MKNIEENNRIIAEFIDEELRTFSKTSSRHLIRYGKKSFHSIEECTKACEEINKTAPLDEIELLLNPFEFVEPRYLRTRLGVASLEYHKSWNWLIPAYHKVTTECWGDTDYPNEYSKLIDQFTVQIQENSPKKACELLANFIKWFTEKNLRM